MTSSTWHAVNLFTGEIGPPVEAPKRTHRPDAAFTALVKLCGYEGAVLTDSLRGALNKARGQIVKAEREANEEISLDDIAELLDGFLSWFKTYRRERFNENCRRSPYPMETAKLWPEYRKAPVDIASDWKAVVDAQKANPDSLYNRLNCKTMDEYDDENTIDTD